MRMKLIALAFAALMFREPAPAESQAATPAAANAACAAGLPPGVRCGTVDVPEDRDHPSGRRIALNYAVIPGPRAAEAGPGQAPPLVLLAGGPGQGAVAVGPMLLGDLRAIAPEADILLVDQRGTGHSNPLTCAGGFELLASGREDLVRRCIAELETHASLAEYGTGEAVRDLEAVRSALGYDRLDLMAVSYGTRPAAAYMRAYPDRVRAVIMRAAGPPDFNIIGEGLVNADAEIARIVADCAADARCAADFPRLAAQMRALEQRLDAAPERVRAPDGSEIVVTRDLYQQMLYALMLTAPSRQQIPRAVATAAETGFGPLAPVLKAVRDQLYGALPVGMYLSVVCAEDVARVAADAPVPETGFASGLPTLRSLCTMWPAGRPDRGLFAPLSAPIPTLIISGAHDPVTTVAAAERLKAMLPHARHLIVPATAHAPVLPECLRGAARRLLETGRLPDEAVDCSAVTMPPFARRPAAAAATAAAATP